MKKQRSTGSTLFRVLLGLGLIGAGAVGVSKGVKHLTSSDEPSDEDGYTELPSDEE